MPVLKDLKSENLVYPSSFTGLPSSLFFISLSVCCVWHCMPPSKLFPW